MRTGSVALAVAAWISAAPARAQQAAPTDGPTLPASVTPLRDERPARFELTGGNVFAATRVGEDAEFFWVQLPSGQLARVRKSEVVSLRYRDEDGKTKFCHTLNNTVIASPRVLIPILELYQNQDGSVTIPEALRPYMQGRERIG